VTARWITRIGRAFQDRDCAPVPGKVGGVIESTSRLQTGSTETTSYWIISVAPTSSRFPSYWGLSFNIKERCRSARNCCIAEPAGMYLPFWGRTEVRKAA